MKSNVTLKSNIFIRAGTVGNAVPLWDDTKFLSVVSGHAALRKLLSLDPAKFQRLSTAPQKSELNRFGICEHSRFTDGARGEIAFGLALSDDGVSDGTVSCRCERGDCEFFGECMTQAGAKRIIRGVCAPEPEQPKEDLFNTPRVTDFLTALDAFTVKAVTKKTADCVSSVAVKVGDEEMNSEIEALEAEIAAINAVEVTTKKTSQWNVTEEIAEDEPDVNFEILSGLTEFDEFSLIQEYQSLEVKTPEKRDSVQPELPQPVSVQQDLPRPVSVKPDSAQPTGQGRAGGRSIRPRTRRNIQRVAEWLPPASISAKSAEPQPVSPQSLQSPEPAENMGLFSGISELPANSEVTIVCENESDIYFISRLFRKHGVPHRTKYKRPALSRIYADLFWDYSSEMMTADMFMDRYAARVYHSRGSLNLPTAEEMWQGLAGFQVNGKLCAGKLTDRLVNYSNGVSVTVPGVFLGGYGGDGSGIEIGLFDTVSKLPDTENRFCFFYAGALRSGDFDVQIADFAESKIDGDGENIKFFRLEHQGGAEFLLPPETIRESFITAGGKSPVQLQAYISREIKVGETLTRRGAEILHGGTVIGTAKNFPENGEFYVRDIVSFAVKRGQKLPLWFGQSRTWLGIEID